MLSKETSGGWERLVLLITIRASLSATSPIRSRSVTALEIIRINRRSEAVGWRLAMMRVHSSSMLISMSLTRKSVSTMRRASSRS